MSMHSEDGPLTTQYVRRAARGDLPSVEWLVERFTPLLLVQAQYRLRPPLSSVYEPEDLVSDVWVRSLPRLEDLEPRGGRYTPVLLRFLSKVLLNRVNTLVRKHILGKPAQRPLEEIEGDAGPFADETTTVVTRAVRGESIRAVVDALHGLPAQDREIIVLRAIEQVPNRLAAQILDIPTNTAAVRYGRALERLRSAAPAPWLEAFGD